VFWHRNFYTEIS